MNKRSIFFTVVLLAFAPSLMAGPLLAPGDQGLRHDLQLLADAGVLKGPINTWPLPWAQLSSDLRHADVDDLTPAEAGALARLQSKLRPNKRKKQQRSGLFFRGGSEPQFLRSFDDTPRAEAETGAYLDFVNRGLGGRLQLSYALDPQDGEEVRLDGSWIGVASGNWMLAAGFLDRYWGPAWQGGLIVSNNARPRPGITLRRIRSTPFESFLLSWLGPWHFTLFTERLESDRGVPNALLAGTRFAFKPFESIEFGVSRTAQFGGDGRRLGFDTIVNVVTGQSTSTNPAIGSAEGINQLGGIDIRWNLPFINAAVYTELTGEDENGSRPALILAQGGAEIWGGFGDAGASWRFIFERADTKANAFGGEESEDDTSIAYNNQEFPTGYRYRGRSLGHPADGDALLNFLRFIYVSPSGHQWRIAGTTGEVNRTTLGGRGVLNSLTPRNEDVNAVDLGYAGQFHWGKLELGLGITDRTFEGGDSTKVHGWVGISREFR